MRKLVLLLASVMCFAVTSAGCNVMDFFGVNTGNSQSSVEKTVLTAKTEMTLEIGESANMDATVTPAMDITYVSSDDTVATVDETGLITAVAEGTADITARAGGETVKCVVTVPHAYIYEIVLDKNSHELFVNGEATIAYSITADGEAYELAEGESVTITSGNTAVATVENNTIKAISVGETVVSVKAIIDGKEYVQNINVNVIASAILKYNVEGVVSEGVEYALNREIQKPQDPTLAGYEFFGWYVDETPFDFEAGISEDTVVTAKFAEVKKLVASDERAVTFANSWIQGVTSYTYTTDVKFGNEAGSTAVCSDFNDFDGAWCEPKLGDFSFTKYYKIWFSFSFDKVTNFSFNTAVDTYSNWVTAVPGTVYTCTIQVNENEGHVNVWLTGTDYLDGDLWYYNLERTNLNDAAFTHVTKVDEVTMHIGAIYGARYPGAIETAGIQYSVDGQLSEKFEYEVGTAIDKPADPTLAGYEFYGWYVDETPFDFNAGITEDTVVTAKFAKVEKLVASDEAAVTFENSWIQGVTSYTYTTDVKVEGEAGSTMVSSDFNGAWCEPKLGDFAFSKYNKIYFSFGFDKACDFSFNTGDESYSNWVKAEPGKMYTCVIQNNENEGHVNVWLIGTDYLEGDLWYYNLAWENLNERALTHTTKAGADKITMYIGAIWGVVNPDWVEPEVQTEVVKLVASDEAAVTFDNSWIQGSTTYTYTTDVKFGSEAGSTMVSSDFNGAWCEPKLGNFNFSEYNKIYFSFSFDKACDFSFNTGDESYSNWVKAEPGKMYTCVIQNNENEGHVNVWLIGTDYLEGDLWYYNLAWENLNERAFTHTTKAGEEKITMYIGAIWGEKVSE